LPGLSAEQEGIGLGHRLKKVSANVIVPIRLRPAALGKAPFGIFVCATWRLDHAVQRDKFSDDKFSHVFSPFDLSTSSVVYLPDAKLFVNKSLPYLLSSLPTGW
jgi:hypothetical protein